MDGEARHLKLNKRIALKCPRFEYRRRLSPEARNSLGVTHTNVCHVYEMHSAQTESGDLDFLTMEYLEGETLATRSYVCAPALAGNAELARQIGAGLQAIHGQGVIQRDLKSSGIMLTVDHAARPRTSPASSLMNSAIMLSPNGIGEKRFGWRRPRRWPV